MSEPIHRTRLFTGCIVSLVATAFGFAVRAAILEDWRSEFNLTQEQIGYILGAGLFPFAISICSATRTRPIQPSARCLPMI